MNNKIHDEYATKPKTIKPIFIRAIEYLGQLQIESRQHLMRNPKGIK
jgi:hypothetical protein